MNSVEIRKSKINGKGTYALKDFKKGDVVIIWSPKKMVNKEKMSKISRNDQNHSTYTGDNKYIIMGSPERFVNHSCDANTFVKNRKDIAKRKIKKGDEITTDYSLNGIEDWKLACKCGSKKCRKIVYGDFRKLNLKVQKRLTLYLEKWYKRETEK